MALISKYKQSFGSVSKDYKKYRGSYTKELYSFLFSLIQNNSREVTILDLGCGVGNSTEPLFSMAVKNKQPISVIGCDPDEQMLKEARLSAKKNKLPIVYVSGIAEKLPFEKAQFDLIISGAAFHWFATKKALKEVQRVLKSGGVYFVFWEQSIKTKEPVVGIEWYKKYKWQGIPKELRELSYVKNIFIQNGFSKVRTLKMSYTEKRTITETLGLIRTNSSYALLSPADKKIFMRGMTAAYKKAFGSNLDVSKQEIRVCYGIRS